MSYELQFTAAYCSWKLSVLLLNLDCRCYYYTLTVGLFTISRLSVILQHYVGLITALSCLSCYNIVSVLLQQRKIPVCLVTIAWPVCVITIYCRSYYWHPMEALNSYWIDCPNDKIVPFISRNLRFYNFMCICAQNLIFLLEIFKTHCVMYVVYY